MVQTPFYVHAKAGIFLFFLFSLFASTQASFVQVSVIGGPFVTDQNILILTKVFDDNGSAKNNVDINSFVTRNSTGTVSDINYLGSVQGVIARNVILSNAGDYNITSVDLNNNKSATVTISVRSVKTATAVFFPHSPPFNKGSSEDINFSLQGKSSTNADLNVMLVARLISDANGAQAISSIDVNANGLTTYAFDTAGLSQGLYFIDVNNGLANIPVPVFQFKGFLDFKNDQNNSTNVFGQGKNISFVIKATNFDGNVNQTISNVTVSVRNPTGDSNSNISCTTGNQAVCAFVVPSDANNGDYVVSATITVGSDTLMVRRSFTVQSYHLSFFTQDFAGGDAGKEKMPSVFPTRSTVSLEAHFANTSTGSELTGSDLNNTFCQDQNIRVFIATAGSSDRNRMSDTTSYSTSANNYCLVQVTAPATQGTFIVTAEATVAGQTLHASTMLIIQNYLIFTSPVAPQTFDPNSPSGKFVFFKGESIGLNPHYVDLNGSLNPKIAAVTQIKVFEESQIQRFSGSDINWNRDLNIITLSASAVNTLTGGFKPVEITVDVNAADANSTGITAFGMFKLSLLNLTATLWDSNNAITGSAKSGQFGPPSVGLDENIFIKVTATTGSGTGVSGATVQLISMRNMDNWQEATVSGISTKVTDANGNAILDIGKLQNLGLPSGGYLMESKVTTTDGNQDTIETFVESRRFMVFLQPVDTSTGTQCGFAQGFRKDGNATFVVRAFNPRTGFGAGDINVIVANSGAATLHYFGSPTSPQFPPLTLSNLTYDINTQYPCMAMGGGQGQTSNQTMIKIRKPDTNFQTGFFDVSLVVDANGGTFDGNREVGHGFMRIQSFDFGAEPNTLGQFGPPTGKPGQPFDINLTILGADGNVRITAKLLDPMSGENFDPMGGSGSGTQTDLNIGFKRPGQALDCNATRCPWKDINLTNNVNPVDANVISVIIPSNSKQQEYLVSLSATDASNNSAEAEVFLTIKLYKVVNFGWYSSLFGVYGLQNQAPADWNTEGKTVQQVYQYTPQGGSDPNAPPNIDYNFLVNYTGRSFTVDTNRDRNFTDNPDLSVGADINNMYRIVDISRVGSEPGVKFIRKSALDNTESQFSYLGTYPTDVNFTVPLLIKDVNGSAMDANVIISNVARFTAGSFVPQNLSATSCATLAQLQSCTISNDFNSWHRQTDANGFVLLPVRIARPGSRTMLEITIYRNSATAITQSQRLQPFEGPTIDIVKYSVTTKIAGPTFTLNYDTNYQASATLSDLNVSYPYGDHNKFVATYVGLNDNNGPAGSVSDDRNWFFVRTMDGNVFIDDDKNLAQSSQPYRDGNVTEAGTIVESLCTQLSSSCSLTNGNGSNPQIYLDANATDANIFDGNIIFYPVYSDPFGNAPPYTSTLQLFIAPTDLSGTPISSTYSVSGIRLENFTRFSTETISCSNCTNRTGPLLINLGNFTSRGGGPYNIVFNLTVGSDEATENRVFMNVGG